MTSKDIIKEIFSYIIPFVIGMLNAYAILNAVYPKFDFATDDPIAIGVLVPASNFALALYFFWEPAQQSNVLNKLVAKIESVSTEIKEHIVGESTGFKDIFHRLCALIEKSINDNQKLYMLLPVPSFGAISKNTAEKYRYYKVLLERVVSRPQATHLMYLNPFAADFSGGHNPVLQYYASISRIGSSTLYNLDIRENLLEYFETFNIVLKKLHTGVKIILVNRQELNLCIVDNEFKPQTFLAFLGNNLMNKISADGGNKEQEMEKLTTGLFSVTNSVNELAKSLFRLKSHEAESLDLIGSYNKEATQRLITGYIEILNDKSLSIDQLYKKLDRCKQEVWKQYQ